CHALRRRSEALADTRQAALGRARHRRGHVSRPSALRGPQRRGNRAARPRGGCELPRSIRQQRERPRVAMERFKAFRVHTIDGRAECRFEDLTIDEIDAGSVTIKVAYSSMNYKDAMAARGIGKNVRTDRPCVTGVD